MKNPLQNKWFKWFFGIYLLLLIVKKSGFYLGLISDYGADLLSMPVLLSMVQWTMLKFEPKAKSKILSSLQIAFAFVFFSTLFEFLFPLLDNRFTADPFDVFAYALGSLFYFFFMRQNPA